MRGGREGWGVGDGNRESEVCVERLSGAERVREQDRREKEEEKVVF